jgi:hypothetical protein
MFLSTRWLPWALVLCGIGGAGCGARTGIYLGDAGADAAPVVCTVDADCATGDACAPAECREGMCVSLPATVCNDHDECTTDSCDSSTGKCVFTPVTLDLDGDGYRSPRPGFAPGAPGSCGDDCDDTSAAAHPGGIEICDGVDNNCNGQIDEGATYGGASAPVRVSSTRFDMADGGALAFDGKNYGAIYTGHTTLWSSYFQGLARDGSSVVAETPLTDINSETYSGPILYNGRFFERSWEDARADANYEIWFNRFDSNGIKLAPDLRVTRAPNFSLDSALVWNGTESLIVWDDRRFDQGTMADVRLFGQRVAFDGSLIGSNIELTAAGVQAEHPGLALGQQRVGIVFASQLTATTRHTEFFSTAADLTDVSPLVDLGGTDVDSSNLVYVGGHFIVAWQRDSSSTGYGPSISGAVVDESGNVLVPEQPITSGATIARSFSLLSLGDRVIVTWADNHDGNFELYWEMLDANLEVLTPRTRLTFTPSDTFFPAVSFGPYGDIGIVYQDWATNFSQIYFLSMGCAMDILPK